MKYNIQFIFEIKNKLPELGGVLTLADLANLVGEYEKQTINNLARKLIDLKIIKRFINGIYVTEDFSPEILCQKIYPKSYISLGTVLAKELIIGSIPKKTIYAVKLGRNKELENENIRIKYFSISKDHFFGWKVKNGICYAVKEKALLDFLYFYQKGFKPSVNIYSDLNLEDVNQHEIEKMLRKYKNIKFKKFVKSLFKEYGN